MIEGWPDVPGVWTSLESVNRESRTSVTLEGDAASVPDPLLQGDGRCEPGALDLPSKLPSRRSKAFRRQLSEFETSGLRAPAGQTIRREHSGLEASGLRALAGQTIRRGHSEPEASGVRAPARPGAGDLALALARCGGLLGAGHGARNERGGWPGRLGLAGRGRLGLPHPGRLSRLQEANLRGIRRTRLQRPGGRRHDADPDPQQQDRPAPVSGHTDPLQEPSGSPFVSASGRGR